MRFRSFLLKSAVLALVAATSGCVTRPPTIAHVHIGHAVTAVHVTPGHQGYILVARQKANEALAAATKARQAAELPQIKAAIAAAVSASDSIDDFGVKQSLTLAANHISFAATSADASDNVVKFAPMFKDDIAAVIGRCDYIVLIGKDVAASGTVQEAQLLVQEILHAAQANVGGDTSNGDARGVMPADYGMVQLQSQLSAMIARENPPYRTVDEWYLFNLVRLPNGRWVFDKLARGGNIDGYK